jgi:hypothetical protein
MAEQELRNLLDQLRGELDQADQLDESERDLLRTLVTDIEKRLDPAVEEDIPLLGGLQDAIERFESSHPALTTLLSDALTALSNAGI